MEDYTRELMDLKTLVARTLEKKGVLAKIRAELRASVFEAIEEEDRALENEDGASPALLGSCNDQARQLHASPSGKLLTALICEYLEWAQLGHTLKVYLPECNLQKGFWRSEIREKFGATDDTESSRDGESRPLLMEVLETYLRQEERNVSANLPKGNSRRSNAEGASTSSADDSSSVVERHMRRPPSSNAGSLAPIARHAQGTQSVRNSGVGNVLDQAIVNDDFFDMVSNRKSSSNISYAGTTRENGSFPGMRKEDRGWRYDDKQHSDDVIRTANALENIQLDRKARSLTSSWRNVDDGIIEDDIQSERDTF